MTSRAATCSGRVVRQGDPEGAALAELALHGDLSLVGGHDGADDGEAEPRARDVLLEGRATAEDPPEDVLDALGRDAHAGVADGELDGACSLAEYDRHHAAVVAVLQ